MANSIKLNDLLPDNLESVAGQVRERLCEDESIGGMKLAWDYIGKELNKSLKAALDCDLLDVLGKMWAGLGEIAEFAHPDKHPPGERGVVAIGKHELKRGLHPVIAVTVGPCPCVELKFLFELTASVSGVRLSIQDGYIVGGDLGELWASAQLSFEGIPLHAPRESSKIGLPGEFAFDPEIKIPRISTPPG